MRRSAPLQTFNRGIVSKLGLARVDLDRLRLSAERAVNWMPRTLGSMMLRPGLQYIGGTQSNNLARIIPFVFGTTDTALLEASSGTVVVWADDSLITRVGSTSVFTNGAFTSDLTGWTDADETGSTSQWVTGGYMGLTGTAYAAARRRQQVTSAAQNHGIALEVERGRPFLRVGSSAGGDDYFTETVLRPGVYSFLITSTGDFHVELGSNSVYESLITSIAVESSGTMTLASPWTEANLADLRWKQSADLIFLANDGVKPRRIERHATESWGLAEYDPEDGPFRIINTGTKRIAPSALSGNITLTSDQPLFVSGQEDSLWKITSVGQQVDATITGSDQWSDSIRVSGVDTSRVFNILIDTLGTVATSSTDITMRVQRSIGEEGAWSDVSGLSWTSTIATTHNDGLDNQIVFYRLGSGSTDFASTSTGANSAGQLTYDSGGITGIARITSVVSATESSAIVLTNFGSTAQSELWSEGEWSSYRGYPSAVTLHEGRVGWAGRSKLWLSQTDSYETFDEDVEGDSAAINKTFGEGPIDKIEWMLSLNRLLIGTQGNEAEAKTSSLEEPLTPTNFALRDVATQGSANVQAVKVDKRAFFVQRGGTRVYELSNTQSALILGSLLLLTCP